MPYQHKNRRGDVYYIQTTNRGGKISYSAARKPSGEPVDRLPEGYEIYEYPENAQVFVRKIKATKILTSERKLVESSIRKLAKLEHFVVDVERDSLVVYMTDAEPDASLIMLRSLAPMTAAQAKSTKDYMLSHARYTKMLRFTLTDEAGRIFSADRWCFLGSIDNWYFLTGDKPLAELAEAYVPHLGQESFFELRRS